MEDYQVKHIKSMSRRGVVAANEYQDLICRLAELFNALLGFFGGASPVGLWIDSKCAIPTPNPGTGTTTTV